MVNYRRNLVPGGTFFFTVALRNRRSHWLTEHITELRGALRNTRNTQPFWIDAIVVLPDHLHTIWTLAPGDIDYPGRWKAINSRFTRALETAGQKLGKRKDGSALVWQRRYWEHAGLATAGFLILVGLTGSLLAFLPEISHALSPHLFPPSRPA